MPKILANDYVGVNAYGVTKIVNSPKHIPSTNELHKWMKSGEDQDGGRVKEACGIDRARR
ncbi:hypothetical protein J41TS12_33970 [Paenibacillus antibioticophila]|uniref:Uncharacterized protein n=1 Tax=Paenibacillus antibioticophila TaxID=1274374 RepID=A0A919XU79_9BACL|nr:hypothetical protein J41TS12_33970 [Paenibacillus antibioticophila]